MTPNTTTNKTRKRRDRPFPWPCVNCLKDEVYPEKTPYAADLKHDGRLHHIEISELTIPKCRACGELVFSNSVDDQIMEALRSHLNLLTPEQIKAGRKALGLKSKELANRLGVADATISRWEKKRLIQSRAMDNLLRVYFAVPEARAVLKGPNQDVALGTPAVPHPEAKKPATDLGVRPGGAFGKGRLMGRSDRQIVLNRIPVTSWVLGTAEKMREANTEAVSDWNRFWLKTYQELGGCSGESGSKGCPKAAAFALWFLGWLREGGRTLLSWAVPQINQDLGKNAAYVVIAAELLEKGASPATKQLWPLVQARYQEYTGQEAADSEQGEIRLVVALFRERQLVNSQDGRA